jgi:hypothetical protein
VEELCSQLALEQPDLLAQRLGNREPLGGAAEMAFFGQGDKVAEMGSSIATTRPRSFPWRFRVRRICSLIGRFNSLLGRLGNFARLQ